MKILFYSDSVPLGGHELMSIRLANQLALFNEYDVSFLSPKTFHSKLEGRVTKLNNTVPSRPLNGSLGHIFINDYISLFKAIKTQNPDLIVVCQGTIELGVKSVIVAKLLRIKVVSYIPLVIDLLATGSSFFPRIRNVLNNFLYMLPDGFITISNYHRNELYKKNRFNRPVSVLRNWVEFNMPANDSLVIREDISDWVQKQKLEMKIVILIIGRIEFKHKQQDKFLKFVCNGMLNKNVSILFAGIGRDSAELISIIEENNLNNVFYSGNVNNVDELYRVVDGICICSSFEGVPLVMLEAINWSLPVFSFNFEALSDYLPPSFLVPNQDFPLLIEKINNYDFSQKSSIYSSSYKEPFNDEMECISKQLKSTYNK